MGVILLIAFLLIVGFTFALWPEQFRDWLLKSYRWAGFTRRIWMQDLMFARSYILAYRIGGAIAIGMAVVLIWLRLRAVL